MVSNHKNASENDKKMLVESMQRIMLLAMENQRLQTTNHKIKAENGSLLHRIDNLQIKIRSIATFEEEIRRLQEERNQYYTYYEQMEVHLKEKAILLEESQKLKQQNANLGKQLQGALKKLS